MKIESRAFSEKSDLSLRKARIVLQAASVEPLMYEEVARHAYYAAFHAAQALIFERIGKVSKTHTGTHSLFNSVARSEPALNLEIRSFLKISYDYKTVADYETGASGASEID